MNQAKISQWKRQYGKIYLIKLGGQEYIFRAMNVGESEDFLRFARVNDTLSAERVALQAVLHPRHVDYDRLPSGHIEKLVSEIVNISPGILDKNFMACVNRARERYAERYDINFFQWKLVINKFLPGYTLDQLDKLSVDDLMFLLVIIEKMTGESIIFPDTKKKGGRHSAASRRQLTPEEEVSVTQATESLRQAWLSGRKK